MSKKTEAAKPAEAGAPDTSAEEVTPTTESPIDAAARAEIAAMQPAAAPKGITEEAIQAKITESLRGLSREQAIQVLQAQRDEDARVAKEAKAKG